MSHNIDRASYKTREGCHGYPPASPKVSLEPRKPLPTSHSLHSPKSHLAPRRNNIQDVYEDYLLNVPYVLAFMFYIYAPSLFIFFLAFSLSSFSLPSLSSFISPISSSTTLTTSSKESQQHKLTLSHREGNLVRLRCSRPQRHGQDSC